MSQLQVTGEAKIRDIQGPVVANSGVITALDGAASQYVRGDGTLADFPTSSGGGSSVSYYLNSSVSQGTIGGVAYRELSKDPIIGAGTDIAISANGYVANYITDANDPDVIIVPGGNFNCEFYFSVNNETGNPTTYAELYKYDGTTFTLLGSSVGVPESINQGTTIAPYYFAIPVPTSALAVTDRLAIRIYVNVDGRTVTLHTENSHLCQVVTTLSKGMVSLNNLTDQSQYLTTGTSGTDFNIVSSGDTHTFNIPSASASNRGLITTGAQTIAGSKTFSSAISADAGVLLKNGFTTYSNAYTSLSGDVGSLVISGSISSTPFDNVLAFAPLTSNTYTFPDVTGTIALLEGTQTFTGVKTFSENPIINGTGTNSAYTILQSAGTNKWRIGNNYAAGVNTFDIFAYDNSSTPLSINSNGAMTLSANVTTTGAQFVQNGFYLTNANGGSLAGYTHMWARNEGINFGLRNGTGGASFIFPSANSYNYTFPAASGTLALSSDLSAYLPLTGGTLTGALSGTSASFGNTGTGNNVISISNNDQANTRLRITNTGGSGRTYSIVGGLNGANNSSFSIFDETAGATRLEIASTGAATFSNSVTAQNDGAFYRLKRTSGTDLGYITDSTTWGASGTDFAIGASSANMVFYTNNSVVERMRITSGGQVGIGTSAPGNYYSTKLVVAVGGEDGITIAGSGNNFLMFADGQTGLDRYRGFIHYSHDSNFLAFGSDATERMRITSGGNVLINRSSLSGDAGGALFQLSQSNANWIHYVENTASSGAVYGSYINFKNQAPNNTASFFTYFGDSSTARFYVYANGGIANYQANNSNLSDERTKKDIIPLESYWDKFKAIEIVKFKYKDQTHDDFNIGVIAQQVESVAPEFIDVDGWGETPEDGVPLKSVYTADLHHATIKVLQECMSKIEEQQAQIEELKELIKNK